MKVVIDIPNEMYDWLDNGFPDKDDAERLWQVVKNGTPLDDIRAEIEQTAKDYDKFNDYRRVRGLWIALDIIDRHMKGVSE